MKKYLLSAITLAVMSGNLLADFKIGSWKEEQFDLAMNCFGGLMNKSMTPSTSDLKLGKTWVCTNVRLSKDKKIQKIYYRADGITNFYQFSKSSTAISNSLLTNSRYLPFENDQGEVQQGLMNFITAVGSWLIDVVRVTPEGYLVSEWSVGLSTAQNSADSYAHPEAPKSVTSGSVERVVTSYSLCAQDQDRALLEQHACLR